MEAPAEICENYQLKWSSYTSYIHSCIASSLLSEDSFADVALVTMDGHKIMAHRFVLSYSSQYLNKALRFQPKVTTALPIMIVLPQEISYKALKILVKYMYSGEATVPKDILSSVLKGGDILKIKGLYREPSSASSASSSIDEDNKISSKSNNKADTHISKTVKETTKSSSSDSSSSIINKNPPALVTSSQKIPQSSETTTTKAKEVQKVQQKLQHTKIQQQKTLQETKSNSSSSSSSVKQYGGPRVLNFSLTNFNGMEKDTVVSPKPRAIILNQKILQKEKPHTITSADAESQNSSDSISTTTTTTTTIKESGKTDNLSYLLIKNEPGEWGDDDMEIVEEIKEVFPEESVKTESYDSTSNDGSINETYTPLTCELCTETFTIPADWVKHVQTHTDMLPAKRRRRDSPDEEEDENASYPELGCDLCEKSFPTPAEWVRHIQDTHTEFELSLSNRKNHHQLRKSSIKKYKGVMKK